MTSLPCPALLPLLSAGVVCACLAASTAASDGVLVLQNHNVLRGAVVRTGDVYHVTQRGAEIMVPAGQVKTFCRSMDEAYETLRSTIGAQRASSRAAHEHVQLARWCLRYDLFTYAARELRVVRNVDPDHPALPTLERELEQRFRLSRQVAAAGATAKVPDQPLRMPEVDRDVVPVSAKARAEFVRRIQPILIQSCATAACHRAGDQQTTPSDHSDSLDQQQLRTPSLMLNDAAADGGIPALTRANLQAVFDQIDSDDPERSELVARARTPHGPAGGGRSRPLRSHQAALLVDWAWEVAGRQPREAAPTDRSYDADVPVDQPRGEPNGPLSSSLNDVHDARRPAPQDAWTPRDRFDPEIFNRRQAAGRGAAAPTERAEAP